MKRSALAASVLLIVALGWLLQSDRPLGVPGEWTWSRLDQGVEPLAIAVGLGLVGAALYALFVGCGTRRLSRTRLSRLEETLWLLSLAPATVAVQLVLVSAAPPGYGLTKWVTIAMSGSSGYFEVAEAEMEDPWAFLEDYPGWIQEQDALHIGTHPPGLFVVSKAALAAMEAAPETARAIDRVLPETLARGFETILGPMPPTRRAAIALIGAFTLLMSGLTAPFIYAMALSFLHSKGSAWVAAALWGVVPAAALFHPASDTAFPCLSVAALALASRGGRGSAVGAGVVLAVGMAFSLVFLAVGLLVGLLELTRFDRPLRGRLVLIGSTGLGFLAPTLMAWGVTDANPFAIWWWNQVNHARFYVEFPRSYTAWVVINPIETAVALGLPAAVWTVLGLSRRQAPRVAWLTVGVLAVLTVSGRSLSEVARLWLPFDPALLVAAGAGLERASAGSATSAATVFLMAVQVILMQMWIQVVYPV